jgi:hypothetical protein
MASSSAIFSLGILSAQVQISRYPRRLAAIASPTPVLPEVGSTIVPPGLSWPAFSAASIMAMPMRSFTLPPGLKYSTLPARVAGPEWKRPSLTRGVFPNVSRMFS